jgi:hypothetical protein
MTSDISRHCEKRSDEAIQTISAVRLWIASLLAMTLGEYRMRITAIRTHILQANDALAPRMQRSGSAVRCWSGAHEATRGSAAVPVLRSSVARCIAPGTREAGWDLSTSSGALRRGDSSKASFRGDAQHRTRNLEIPGLVLSLHPGNDAGGLSRVPPAHRLPGDLPDMSSPSVKNISLYQKCESDVVSRLSRTRSEGRIAIVTDVGAGRDGRRRRA